MPAGPYRGPAGNFYWYDIVLEQQNRPNISCANFKTSLLTLMSYYDENHSEISKTDYTPEEVTDYQTFELGSEVGSVEIICYDANGSELETMTITPDNPSTVICFDDGGQILASRYLRFTWEK